MSRADFVVRLPFTLRRALGLAVALAALTALGCDDAKTGAGGSAPSRFDAPKTPKVSSETSAKAQASFCEVTYPATGEKSRRWAPPPSQPMAIRAGGAPIDAPKPSGGWRWINLWASWCQPCMAELPLLVRWQATLAKESIPVTFEMWTIDSNPDDLVKALDRRFPGELYWMRSEEDAPDLFEKVGVDRSSAIPMHILVDPQGMLRCVRVGSVGEELYGTIKTIVSGP